MDTVKQVNLIGIIGHAQNGKSTCASRLSELGWRTLPLAGPIKEMLLALGVPPQHLYGDKKETPMPMLCGKTARHAMQTLGTEWGRNHIGGEIWLNTWRIKALSSLAQGTKVVVDDVRFPNEAEAIKEMGGFIIRVYRPSPIPANLNDHSSEALIDSIEPFVTLFNDGSIEDLRDKISVYGEGI